MNSPCELCKIYLNREYSDDCDLSCEYACAIMALKEIKCKVEGMLDLHDTKIKLEVRNLIDQIDQYPLNIESCK